MAATIKIKNSSTTGAVPTSSDLVQGELAVNVTDTGLYTENASGTVVKLNAPSIDDKNTGATKHLTISTGGNLGLGVTPSAWTDYKAFEIGAAGNTLFSTSNEIGIVSNAYWGSSAFKYAASSIATTRYSQTGGQHRWYYAASGTAGNSITFTQAMTLDASGNLGIGATSPTSVLDVLNATPKLTLRDSAGRTLVVYAPNSVDDGFIGTTSNHALPFRTNNTERARIDSSGNLLVGTTSTYGGAKVTFERDTNSTIQVLRSNAYTSGTNYYMQFYAGATETGKITSNGTNNTYATSSDYRLKENIQPMQNALSVVAQLNPVTYTWKVNGAEGQGFIAHELQAVVPDCVVGEKDAVDSDGNPVYQGIDTSFLVATLTAAIQELNAKFEAYKAAHP